MISIIGVPVICWGTLGPEKFCETLIPQVTWPFIVEFTKATGSEKESIVITLIKTPRW